MNHFADRLNTAIKRIGNPVVVGIDPRIDWLPPQFSSSSNPDPVESFCHEVLKVIATKVAAVKFQMAFFERQGHNGLQTLWSVARHARDLGLVVILDGKRNDIGTSAEAYAEAYLVEWGIRDDSYATSYEYYNLPPDRNGYPWTCDALTVTPYLGSDGIDPFVKAAAKNGKGLFVLVRTSNPSAREFQDLICDGKPVYRHVADRLRLWAEPHIGKLGYSLVGAVVGATYPQELAELRAALPGVIFLVPGYGAQGGTAADVAAAFDERGLGAIVNNSRGVVFAYREPRYRERFGDNWQGAIEQALDDMIDDLAANTPAGRLRG